MVHDFCDSCVYINHEPCVVFQLKNMFLGPYNILLPPSFYDLTQIKKVFVFVFKTIKLFTKCCLNIALVQYGVTENANFSESFQSR